MRATVFCSPHWSVLQEKALSLWWDTRSNGLTLLLVPTTTMRSHWLSLLAEKIGGVSGEEVAVLDLLAYRLASTHSSDLFRLAGFSERRIAAREAQSRLDLTEEWLHAGIVDSFLNAIEELELHALSPEAVQSTIRNDSTIEVLTSWWKAWQEVLKERGLWSLGNVLKIATEGLQEKCIVYPKARTILVYGFTALPPARWNFLKTLLDSMDDGDLKVYFFVPGDCENLNAYGYAAPLINRLRKEFNAEIHCLSSELPEEFQALPTLLFRSYRVKRREQEKPCLTDRIVCVSAMGEEQEVETAMRLLTYWRRTGSLKRFSDALLVAYSVESYLPALEAMSARFGVPFTIVGGRGKVHKGLSNLIRAIWGSRLSNWNGESLWQVLPSPYLCHPSKPDEPLLPENRHRDLLSLVRQKMAESGSGKWREILSKKFPGEPFVESVVDFLSAVDQLPIQAPIDEHARRWLQVLNFIRPLDERDERTLQNLETQLKGLKIWSVEISGDEFISLLIGSWVEDMGELEDAVRVATAEDARGQVAPVVVLLGMADNRFPPSLPMFELLTDKYREILTEKLGLTVSLRFRRNPKRFDFATSFALEQRMLFAEMIGIATERLVLTHPQADPDGKPIARSLFLDEVEHALNAAGYDWLKVERDLADVVPRKENDVLPTGVEQAVNTIEAKTAAVFYAFAGRGWTDAEKALVSAILRNENFRERLLTEWRRWTEPQEGRWDGKKLRIEVQPLIEQWRERGVGATTLEDYGHCPYRFFARHILNLRRPREVDYYVDPTVLGNLWHRIVAEFLKAIANSADRTQSLGQELSRFPNREVLREKAREVLEDNPQISQVTQQVFELLWERVEALLDAVWEAERIQAQEWQPKEIEREFSLPIEELGDVPEIFRGIKLTVRPDRVDVNSEGKHRVVDYKTGSPPTEKDIQEGIFLQLPLYALTLQKAGFLVSEAEVLRLLSFKKDRDYRIACILSAEKIPEAIETSKEHARRYLHRIAEADFTVMPSSFSRSCRLCDFKTLCRCHPLRVRERSRKRREQNTN